jgi:ribosomal-protein-alanine N-acetyltransferase
MRQPGLKLVPPKAEYAELFYSWRTQPLFIKHNPLKRLTLAECRKRLRAEGSDLKSRKPHASYRWFVKYGGKIVGSVSLSNINGMMRTAEISYGLDDAWHSRGLGTRAVSLLVKKVFAGTGLRKLLAVVHDGNVASQRLLEKIGFKKEGFLREHYLINGKPEDEVLYGLLRADKITYFP